MTDRRNMGLGGHMVLREGIQDIFGTLGIGWCVKAADFSVGLTSSVRKRMVQGRESSQLLEGHGVHHLPHVCEHTAVSQHPGTLK